MSEWATAKQGILETYGIGTCIGIALYDRHKRTGYLAHVATPPTGTDNYMPDALDEMITAVKDAGHEPDSLQAWVAGGQFAPYTPEDREIALAERAQCLAKLAELGLQESPIDIHWIEPDESLDITLDCDTGECMLTTEWAQE